MDGMVSMVGKWSVTDVLSVKRGLSQAFYREKLHEKHFGYPDLESFMVGFWEAWATSKGTYIRMPNNPPTTLFSTFRLTEETLNRSREHARDAPHVAKRRLLPARALRRQL